MGELAQADEGVRKHPVPVLLFAYLLPPDAVRSATLRSHKGDTNRFCGTRNGVIVCGHRGTSLLPARRHPGAARFRLRRAMSSVAIGCLLVLGLGGCSWSSDDHGPTAQQEAAAVCSKGTPPVEEYQRCMVQAGATP